MVISEFPIAIQTAYADLVEHAWTGDIASLMAAGGSAYTREEKGRRYWYWQPPTLGGRRPHARYIGPDTEPTRTRVQALSDQADALRSRRELVRSLRAAR